MYGKRKEIMFSGNVFCLHLRPKIEVEKNTWKGKKWEAEMKDLRLRFLRQKSWNIKTFSFYRQKV